MSPDFLILCATLPEMSYFLSAHPPESKKPTRTGLTVFSGSIHHKPYDLMITGPGVFNAVHALTVYLEQSLPSLILQTGIAGVFRETGLNIGDVAIATEEHYIHTGLATDSPVKVPLPFDLIESFPLTREGRYPFASDLVEPYYEKLSREFAFGKIRMAKGHFITVSAISASFKQASLIYSSFSPVMEAMEGAGSAHIAALYKIPMIEIRAASNFVGERDKGKWDMEKAAKNLEAVCVFI